MRIDFDLEDLTNSALKRLVKQLLSANDKQEKSIMSKLAKHATGKAEKNDLADLHEEKHGKPNTPQVEEEDDPFDLEAHGHGGEESESDMPPKKGKK